MREILFRGKRLQGGAWIEGYFFRSDMNKIMRESGKATLIFTPDCDTFIFAPEYHNSFMVDAATVGQYTGLRDKNGRRIFEGDILQCDFGQDQIGVQRAVVRDSTDYNPGFVLDPLNDWMYTGWRECEVIGNIYDNPELLEEEST